MGGLVSVASPVAPLSAHWERGWGEGYSSGRGLIVTNWINRSGFSYPARRAYGFSSLGKSMKRMVLNSPQSGPGKNGIAGAFSA